MNNIDYEIKFSDFSILSDLEKLVDLQYEVYPDKTFSIDGFKNWYIENPSGRVISFNAWNGEKMIAHYACIPKKMLINGEIVLGIHSMATVTHPQYRGKGLFKKLAELTYNYAREKGYSFNDIDGARIEFDDGWALVRASNTGPNITARFEATSEERKQELQKEFTDLIERLNK
jgi:GNAT superfamily N-acetyltransferase